MPISGIIQRLLVSVLCSLAIAPASFGQAETPPESTAPAPKTAGLDELQTTIASQQQKLDALQEGADQSVLDTSLIGAYIASKQVDLVAQQLAYMRTCLKQENNEQCRQQSVLWLSSFPQNFETANQHKKSLSLPDEEASATDQALSDARLFEQLAEFDRRDKLFIESLAIARKFNVPQDRFELRIKTTLTQRAATTAVFLEHTLLAENALREASALLPKDEALKARLNTTQNRARRLGTALERVTSLMKLLELDTGEYEALILSATGQLSTDLFASGVMTRMVSGWGKQATDWVMDEGPALIIKIVAVLVILIVAWRIARLAQKITSQALQRSRRPVSQLLHRMVVNTVGNLIIAIGILIALSQVGISLGPLLAGVGVVGFVVGFALQDTLSNFASGIMILLYSPFDVGDVIETGGAFGKVSHMSLVNTTILTLDNQTIVVPNNKIWGEIIKNLTHQKERRVDMLFGIAYSSDYEKAEQILTDIVAENTLILDQPEPVIRMHELGDSSVNFVVRPWVKTENYWEVFWSTTKEVKKRFDAAGIEIPFPQRDVHLDASKPLMVKLENGNA